MLRGFVQFVLLVTSSVTAFHVPSVQPRRIATISSNNGVFGRTIRLQQASSTFASTNSTEIVTTTTVDNELKYFSEGYKNADASFIGAEETFSDDFTTKEVELVNNKEEEESLLEYLGWRSVVVVLCALWASNFAAAKMVMGEPGVDSALYALVRFSIAASALVPGSVAAVRRGVIDMETAKSAAICGGWVSFGYLGQTLGLLTTTASKSCVICSLHCIFVAIIAEWARVSKFNENAEGEESTSFDLKRLIPAAVAVAGVAIIELKGDVLPTIGDALSFAQPIGFGLGYWQLEHMMKKRPEAALPVSAIKLLMVALASFTMFELSPLIFNTSGSFTDGVAALWPPRVPDFAPIFASPVAMGGLLYTGLVTTALALWVESIAFKRVPATDASIILTTEPLFAAAAGAAALGETFGSSDYIGATLIIGACILAVLSEDKKVEKVVS